MNRIPSSPFIISSSVDVEMEDDTSLDLPQISMFEENLKPSRKASRHSDKKKSKKSRWEYEDDY